MESPGNGFFSLHSEAVSMAREAEHRPVGVFECQLCALAAPYSYVGQKPPDTQSVILLEESYVMKDPFTPDKAGFLILGSRCSVCSRLDGDLLSSCSWGTFQSICCTPGPGLGACCTCESPFHPAPN
ncbi:cysteine-rich DPF motif domain-containing protein 1 isoform X4 [Molossus molossus]|uniref:cysteine-rich DPF motif domain-containing protein 1 isoform X4 n=1 Tax=Molossus molossus TaxID=27622 RepID=UPI0017475A39|nr:cysteine-rich DPF motif domain-containing protein 1 isoform X4 [Molossus molossus]